MGKNEEIAQVGVKKLSFQLKESKLNKDYKVKILFFNHKKAKSIKSSHFLWKKKFAISAGNSNMKYHGQPVHDIYSFNGTIDVDLAKQGIDVFWNQYDFSQDYQSLSAIKPHTKPGADENPILK